MSERHGKRLAVVLVAALGIGGIGANRVMASHDGGDNGVVTDVNRSEPVHPHKLPIPDHPILANTLPEQIDDVTQGSPEEPLRVGGKVVGYGIPITGFIASR